jgi:AhpD family alkylhydroperoxidase
MTARIDLQAAPGAYRAMLGLEAYLRDCGLEVKLVTLVKLRVSQINGCGYCIDMHWKDLRALCDEPEHRLYALDAWQESPFYSERERAALAYAEACTNIQDGHVSDEVYDATRAQLSELEIAQLTFVIATINAWNRLAIASRAEPGHYQPKQAAR